MDAWPRYPWGTIEDLDTHVDNYGAPVPDAEVQVQVVPYQTAYDPGEGNHWVAAPYRISGLARGKYDVWTRWVRGNGAKIIDHAGEEGLPSFELV